MAALIRAFDSSATSLGPMSDWPDCLREAVDLMLAAATQIVIFAGPDFVALYNDAYAPTIGEKHPRALGRPARENWGELWSDLEPLLARVRDTGQTVSARDRPFYIERHGYPETVYFDISYSPLRDPAGRVRAVFCIVNETTGRVTAQAALHENEERLRALFDQAMGGIALCGADGRFAMVNTRMCAMLGYTEAELLARRMQDVTHPEDLPGNEALYRRLFAEGTAFVIEKRYLRRDGGMIWVSASVGPIRDREGRVTQASAMIIDITERHRAQAQERQMAAIIASSQDAILSVDLDRRIISWNRGAERLYGYTAAEAIGQTVILLLPPGQAEEEDEIMARILGGLPVEPHETRRRCRDGRLVDVSLAVSPVRDEHGRIVGAAKIARDITGRKEAERLQRMLMGELKHRVKYVLATVQAIARQTFGHAGGEATATFNARLRSLAAAHDLLTRANWEGAELSAIIGEVLGAYPAERFDLSGLRLVLPARSVMAIALALHELATNAAKYGALSEPEGRISVSWAVGGAGPEAGAPGFGLRWQERGGPRVVAPARRGFGSRLIEDVLAVELGGKVQLAYEPEGVVCIISAPLDASWERGPPPG